MVHRGKALQRASHLPSAFFYFFFYSTVIYFKSVLRWEPANATEFSSRTRVRRYHYLGVLVLPSAPQTCSSFVTRPLLSGLHITRLVGSRLGRAFLSIYYYLGVRPRSSEREDGFSRVRERHRAEADEDHGPGWTPYTENIRYWQHARGGPPVRVSR